MDEVIGAEYFAVLDEEALLTIVDDVWGDQGLPITPLQAFESANQARNKTLSTDANVPEACSACITSPKDQEQEPKKPKKKRRHDRPWHEIAQLQSESAELERQLEQHLTSSSKTARRTLLKRNENATLKRMLQESVEDTQTLEHNLFRQMNELVQSLPRSLVMTRNLQYGGAHDDMVFRLMASSVDAQYKDMDQVMRRAGLAGLQTEVMDSYVGRATSEYTGGVTGELLEFRSRILSPFASCTLERACSGSQTKSLPPPR
ncbi:hypothetical protein PR003_g32481 [Phytophthora rubi]|uniref:Uncharacterized protein n=1 Tax=Phytophthora rubi TaxID=129364 RepID=A0A6A3GNP8_9STRA|nr:hypothetical protein PR002_g30877 [Phytophthora rubi]KAE9265360.1 hypothetical protein PR003_g32481 [Phytophthora rubi]